MTTREFYVAVVSGQITDDTIAKAQELLNALDQKNADAAKKKAEKNAKIDEPIKTAIMTFLHDQTEPKTASDICVALKNNGVTAGEAELTTAKVSSMCRQLTADGQLVDGDVKVPKRGKVKGYTVA